MAELYQQEPTWQEMLPAELRTLFGKHDWKAETIGRSGMHVFHIGAGYLKIARRAQTTSAGLMAEKERLNWLQGQLPVPQVYYYGNDAFFEYLYLSEIQGHLACDAVFGADMPRLVHVLAEAMHMVHTLDKQHCPFVFPLQSRLDAIRQRIISGQVDEEKFASDYQGWNLEKWYEQLERQRPDTDDLVFTHGDFCLPNVILDRQKMRINGFIDLGLAGVADRHQDIDSTCWSLGYNFDKAWIPALQEAYGPALIDQEKLAFYQLVDDLVLYLKEPD